MNRDDLPPTVPPGEPPPDAPRGLMARFRNYFLTGLIVAGPVAITLLSDLVVRELGRQPGAAVRADRLPAGNLSAVRAARLRADRRRGRADAARLPHRQPDRPDAGRSRRDGCSAACRWCARSIAA